MCCTYSCTGIAVGGYAKVTPDLSTRYTMIQDVNKRLLACSLPLPCKWLPPRSTDGIPLRRPKASLASPTHGAICSYIGMILRRADGYCRDHPMTHHVRRSIDACPWVTLDAYDYCAVSLQSRPSCTRYALLWL